MPLHNNITWLFSIVATVALFTGGSMLLNNNYSIESEMIQFTDLSDADIEQILAVKAEMNIAKNPLDISSL